jgi:23S rRNA (guanosine2251-2'-O)-methyltransferase
VIAGRRAVFEALSGRTEVAVIYAADPGDAGLSQIRDLANKKRVRLEESSPDALSALAGEARHQGVVAIAGEYPYRDLHGLLDETRAVTNAPLLVALDQVTDPHNFGAIVRSVVAFGARGVITTKDRAVPVTPVVVRASAGATEHVAIARVTNLARSLEQLADEGFEIIGLAGEADESLSDVEPATSGRVLVIGSEGRGLRRLTRRACQRVVRIDMTDAIGSLNASVAAGVALYALTR